MNNIVGTLNLLFALREIKPDCHLVKLGTMGEYGTPNIDIEEGYIKIEHNGRSDVLPFPKQPGSFYHLSKVHDQPQHHVLLPHLGTARHRPEPGRGLRHHTDETALDEGLINRFDYDEVFGTALNRFCIEAAVGHPITVYGKGGQTRGFLDIRDTVRCIEIACQPSGEHGRVPRLQPVHRAVLGAGAGATWCRPPASKFGLKVEIDHLPDPRVEAEAHYYNAKHSNLLDLGLEPHMLVGFAASTR